jgi:FKBP-type peptidyl-prolyl cis-trans isomerase FkpA
MNWMNRILLVLLFFSACLIGCKKSDSGVSSIDAINAQQVKDEKTITTYLTNNNINATVIDSAGISTGIYYKIDTPGTGGSLFTNSTTITVGYKGWLLTNGVVAATPFAQTNQFHPAFVLGTLMRGWQLGVPKGALGGTITLYLPSRYAYGPYAQTQLGLPANAILIFDITLYNITN